MKTNYKLAIALVAGAAVGGAAIQGLHAQAKPPAYIVIPILKINDAAAFKAGVTDKVKPEDLKAAGGEWVIRNTKFTSLDGTPPERLVILKFDSVEKATAAHDSEGYQAALKVLGKGADRDLRIVEGV